MNRYPNQLAIGQYHGAAILLKPWIVAGILLRLLGPILTNYFHTWSISRFSPFCHISPEWCHNTTMTSSSCHIIIYVMPCHHILHIIIHAMSSPPLSFLWLSLSSLLPSCPLVILMSSLNSFWHQWQPYSIFPTWWWWWWWWWKRWYIQVEYIKYVETFLVIMAWPG